MRTCLGATQPRLFQVASPILSRSWHSLVPPLFIELLFFRKSVKRVVVCLLMVDAKRPHRTERDPLSSQQLTLRPLDCYFLPQWVAKVPYGLYALSLWG